MLRSSTRAAALAGLALVCALGAAPAARAQAGLETTVAFLEQSQNADGGFGEGTGRPSDPQVSAWVALALAATGVNPLDQRTGPGQSAYAYLSSQAGGLELVPDFERALLVADAAGADGRDFGGRDLVGTLLSDALPDGSFPYRAGERTPDVNDTSFAVLALSPVRDDAAQRAVARGAEWLEEAQNHDGSWPSTCPRTVESCGEEGDPRGEVDATAAAVEALNAAGRRGTAAQGKALEWLHAAQLPGGGLPEYAFEDEANVASTAWAAQALWAAALSPEQWRSGSGDPLSYMASMQQPDGSIAWRVGQTSEPVWMTAYVVPAFAGRALPIAAVPRQAPPPSEPAPETPSTSQRTPGEVAASHRSAPARARGHGVPVGGGGRGAPLFSRPLPQSTGHRRGATRRLQAVSGTPRSGRRGLPVRAAGAEGGSPHARHPVSGLLVGAAGPGAPGLAASAASEDDRPPAAGALSLAALAALLFAAGAMIERRRSEAVL